MVVTALTTQVEVPYSYKVCHAFHSVRGPYRQFYPIKSRTYALVFWSDKQEN